MNTIKFILKNNNNNNNELVLRNVVNVKTRWNSKYYSWQRLFKLRKAIEWLGATLPLSNNSNDHADGHKLKNLLLKPYEWNLLKQIIDLLEPFNDATTYFSGTSYVTLLIIFPVIQALKYNYIYILPNENNNDSNNNNENNNNKDENNNEQYISNFIHEESSDNDSNSDENNNLDNPSPSSHDQSEHEIAGIAPERHSQLKLKGFKSPLDRIGTHIKKVLPS
ncbi:hypothetical protein Glove_353g27 [Diversispora epigaea]|uniref:Uncharacterized protein n=1 Tax=Diversispora epigaea TaxID=1348612 RepID=A0A397HCE2_9GLOM|nr:hypothetical protein Glove_353g27 [Diversispora epigaea]